MRFLPVLLFLLTGCSGPSKKGLEVADLHREVNWQKRSFDQVEEQNSEAERSIYWKGVKVYDKKGRWAFAQYLSSNKRYLYYVANELKASNFNILRYDSKTKKSLILFAEPGFWLIDQVDEKQGELHLRLLAKEGEKLFTWRLRDKVLQAK